MQTQLRIAPNFLHTAYNDDNFPVCKMLYSTFPQTQCKMHLKCAQCSVHETFTCSRLQIQYRLVSTQQCARTIRGPSHWNLRVTLKTQWPRNFNTMFSCSRNLSSSWDPERSSPPTLTASEWAIPSASYIWHVTASEKHSNLRISTAFCRHLLACVNYCTNESV